MKCENCGKEFEKVTIESGTFDLGSTSYTYHPKCPHCKFDHCPKLTLRGG